MTTATVPNARTLIRRIVERPRLFALLDESKAQVRTLVAPAGYGKSTLAEQWVMREGRRWAWYTARSSATDVAALALGIAGTAAEIVEGCDARLREHLRALPAPAENVETLAEILGEDLSDWPPDAWLVLDDYHEIARSAAAERFVEALAAAAAPLRLLIASRLRPSWVSSRGILYGEFLELNQTVLAMDANEAAAVLVGRDVPSASGLVALANGWPAVIGLASVSTAEIEADADQVPESLYRFFAEEVFSALGEEVQSGLTTLAVAPQIDRDLATILLGGELAESVCAAALDVGILVERGPQLELHPLARAFLEERTGHGPAASDGVVRTCLDHYAERRMWSAAFDVVAKSGAFTELEALTYAALDELVETARLATIQSWCELAAEAALEGAIFSLARAEVLMRHGRHVEAVAHAEAAASKDPGLAFRALLLAGRAAHLASHEDEALGAYVRAEEVAATDAERRDAMWGRVMCLIDLERPEAETLLAQLSHGITLGDAREVVRAACCRICLDMRFGSIDHEEADIASDLLPAVGDPLIESGFLSAYAVSLAYAARYEDAQSAAARLMAIAARYRLSFAVPYAHCAEAMARAGMREWDRAERAALDALELARASRHVHATQMATSIMLRTLAQQGRLQAAVELGADLPRGGLSVSRAELSCSLGLVLACVGQIADAMRLVNDVRGTTDAVEPAVLSAAVDAIASLKSGSTDIVERVAVLEETAFRTGATDLLVVVYRACPELLPLLLRSAESRVPELIRRVGDTDLARASGHAIGATDDRRELLSRRERDVFELLRSGLTNRQIAKALFIEESTAKVHVQHIFDKLGVRSRKTLAVQALLERSGQATSAIDSPNSEPRPS